MTTQNTAVLLLNVGTPDSPDVKDVRNYLSEFLNDPRVIDSPWLLRKILVNLIIVPFRAANSSKLYKQLWNEKGSPLTYHSQSVKSKLQAELGNDYTVLVAMRYANPNIRIVMEEIRKCNFKRIILLPMFPQYASSSTGTAIEAVLSQVKKWTVIPEIRTIGQFYDDPGYLEIFAERIRSYHPEQFDHIVFSYHGLPISHINSVHPDKDCNQCTCAVALPEYGTHCYRATCYETTRLLAAKLGLPACRYSQSFQSRLSDKWLKPYTDKHLEQLAAEGVKKVLITAPAFVSDCLETTVELGIDYRNLFRESGGEELVYVESLNDLPEWINVLKNLVEKA